MVRARCREAAAGRRPAARRNRVARDGIEPVDLAFQAVDLCLHDAQRAGRAAALVGRRAEIGAKVEKSFLMRASMASASPSA